VTISVSEEWIAKRIRLNSEVLDDAVKLRLKSGGEESSADWMERLFDDELYLKTTLMMIDQDTLRAKDSPDR
jgi:hypothetical protein